MLRHALAGSAAILLASTALARAEVDARAVWSDWQGVYARLGGTLEAASEDYADGTLTLAGVTATSEIGEDVSTVEYGDIAMVELDDGTMRIDVPESYAMSQEVAVGEETVEMAFEGTNESLSILVSEADGVRSYDVAADAMTIAFTQPATEDSPEMDVSMRLSGVASTYRSGVGGDPDAFEQDIAAEEAGFAVDLDPGEDEGGPVVMTYAATGMTGTMGGTYGEIPDGPIASLAQMGVEYSGELTHSGSTISVSGLSPQGPFAVDGTSASGTMAFAMGAEAVSYELRSVDAAMDLSLPIFPAPIAVAMAELSTSTAVPMGADEAEKPFGFALALRELTLDDALWALFDPTGQLPRDPATLAVALDGTAVMAVDIFGDPEAMAALEGPPGELRTMNLTELALTLGGAALEGSGALTFPNATPVPEPVGTIELSLEGGFALIDSLVALGLVPAQQAGFVKGMAGAVARPAGDDRLESTIEFSPGGGISANGMPLR